MGTHLPRVASQEVLEALVARAEGFISILQKQHQWAEARAGKVALVLQVMFCQMAVGQNQWDPISG